MGGMGFVRAPFGEFVHHATKVSLAEVGGRVKELAVNDNFFAHNLTEVGQTLLAQGPIVFGKVVLTVDPVVVPRDEFGKSLVRGGTEHHLDLVEVVQHVLRTNDVDFFGLLYLEKVGKVFGKIVLEMVHAVTFSWGRLFKDLLCQERANIALWLRGAAWVVDKESVGKHRVERVVALKEFVFEGVWSGVLFQGVIVNVFEYPAGLDAIDGVSDQEDPGIVTIYLDGPDVVAFTSSLDDVGVLNVLPEL